MVKNYRRKTEGVNRQSLSDAVKAIKNDGMKIAHAAKEFKISVGVLNRNLKTGTLQLDSVTGKVIGIERKAGGNTRIFDKSEEANLVQCLTRCSERFFGLTPLEIKALVYEYANIKRLKMPPVWKEKKQVGLDWYKSFMQSHPEFSARKIREME